MQIINTESEYKAACVADGEKVLAILRYVQGTLKDSLVNPSNTKHELANIFYKYNNLGEVITQIENDLTPFKTPTFK